jgi:hypothetical protein
VDVAIEVAKVPFKVGGAVIDVIGGDDDNSKHSHQHDSKDADSHQHDGDDD